ncbi:MAG: tRNA (guanosine(37)-N1)-methyltransferase TrmD [Candidatus Marinimicrobia bacterium]|nr:tRNA (guanosine(37)-N1)-methyltransferase TrmD [Candidatus Neomarinimicrobiota bacterium]
MKIFIVTAFPQIMEAYLTESMIRKARELGLVKFEIWDIRDFTHDNYRQIDDSPFGGGAGMVMKPEPFFEAHDKIKKLLGKPKPRVIFPSPQGKIFKHDLSLELAQEEDLTFFCGHYKGVDERVIEALVTDEISMGDFVLTGGELPTLAIIDATVRHIPGVLHDYDSAETDSFADNLLEGPIYTKPREYRGLIVPDILLSGHHAKIAEWRQQQRICRTEKRRNDLLEK